MQPRNGRGLGDVEAFVRALIAQGVDVEMTTVARSEVDTVAAESLAIQLGATWRARSWHP